MNAAHAVYWRIATLDALRPAFPESLIEGLSAGERRELAAWRHAGRREQWLLSRVLARRLIRAHAAGDGQASIEICSLDARGRGRRPSVMIDGHPAACCLSLSHTERATLAAISTTPGVTLGVDLSPRAELGAGAVKLWMLDCEREYLARAEPDEGRRLWAIKEAVFKAVNWGEPFAPRQIAVRREPDGRYECHYRGEDLAGHCEISTWDCHGHIAALAQTKARA